MYVYINTINNQFNSIIPSVLYCVYGIIGVDVCVCQSIFYIYVCLGVYDDGCVMSDILMTVVS